MRILAHLEGLQAPAVRDTAYTVADKAEPTAASFAPEGVQPGVKRLTPRRVMASKSLGNGDRQLTEGIDWV